METPVTLLTDTAIGGKLTIRDGVSWCHSSGWYMGGFRGGFLCPSSLRTIKLQGMCLCWWDLLLATKHGLGLSCMSLPKQKFSVCAFWLANICPRLPPPPPKASQCSPSPQGCNKVNSVPLPCNVFPILRPPSGSLPNNRSFLKTVLSLCSPWVTPYGWLMGLLCTVDPTQTPLREWSSHQNLKL